MYNPSICFDDILDNCIVAIQNLGRTVEDCLARYPEQRTELEPLLRLTVRLQAAHALQAPPEFRRTAVTRMHNLVANRPRQVERAAVKPNPLHYIWPRLQAAFRVQRKVPATVVVSVVIALSLLVGGGAVYASADALPGDMLYPVKTAVENVQLAVSLNDARDAELHLSFAARRLEEVAALLGEDRSEGIKQALTDYSIQLESALTFLNQGGRLSTDAQLALASLLVENLSHHEAQLTALLEQVPETDRTAIELALAISQTGRSLALEVVGEKPDRPEGPPELPVTVPTDPFFTSPLLPTDTLTPTSTPTLTPISTPTQTSTATPSPALPTSTLLPAQPTPTPWPEPSILTPWPRPTWRPTRRPMVTPTGAPTERPIKWPTDAPPGWPTELPWPPQEWPTDAPPGWPTELPWPPQEWPTEWPTEWLTTWPTEWPTPSASPEWPTPRPPPRRP